MYPRVLVLLSILLASAAQAAPARPVVDLHYGEVLYYFYQQKYFNAITHLGTAEHFTRIPHPADDAELLRGGLYLSYGLHTEAARIFERLIAAGAPPAVADRAWFYLAKIRYQRGYFAEAETALGHIGTALAPELIDERAVLAALLLMARGEYAQAAEQLQRVPNQSDWSLYARYNLGIALLQSGARDEGVRVLDEIGKLPANIEERRALKDKANVALAFRFLQDDAPLKARDHLQRVRLDGYLSNKALLGLGWAQSALGDDRQALVPWLELHRRNTVDAAVQEALLAVPYAYGRLGAHAQALKYYEDAIALYDHEMNRLTESIAAIRAGKLSENILRQNPGDDMGWFWRLNQMPQSAENRYLVQLLAAHDFQEAFKNYRDLRYLSVNLERHQANFNVYRDMLATRRQGYAERLPRVLKDGRGAEVPRLQARRNELAAALGRVEASADPTAFMSDKERALQQRLDRVAAALPRTDDVEARAKHRLLQGLLTWDASVQYPARLWEAKKTLRAIDAELALATAQREALIAAQRDMPQVFDGFARRIEQLRGRIDILLAELKRVAAEQERHLEQLAIAELERQQARLATYVTQARFALAQIYDQASGAAEAR